LIHEARKHLTGEARQDSKNSMNDGRHDAVFRQKKTTEARCGAPSPGAAGVAAWHRMTSVVLLVLFFAAGMAQYAPAFCCLAEDAIIHEEPGSCCPSEQPAACPEKKACEDKDTCPRTCCSSSSTNLVLHLSSRNGVSRALAAECSPVTTAFSVAQRTLVPYVADAQPPPSLCRLALHLYLQVLLR
jgi:hypothetical protein